MLRRPGATDYSGYAGGDTRRGSQRAPAAWNPGRPARKNRGKQVESNGRPGGGLRERKKAKTRAAIQREALRLFREQGYDGTTVEQIAAEAEVSPSTFFRYFSTKEDVVLYDDLDPIMFAAFAAQPAELGPIQALRAAMRESLATLPAEELVQMQERSELMLAVPDLRRRMLDQFTEAIQLLAELIARRIGRPADDFAVRTWAGAVVGAIIAVMYATRDTPAADLPELFDAALAQLEAGLPR
jgi:AcrR family transcriptional regulator